MLQPDLLVVRDSEVGTTRIETVPQLVVEILSHSTRLTDLSLKKAVYESAGVPAYWTVDPDRPSITVWELRGGDYVEVGAAQGDDECLVALPFAAQIVPQRLLEG